MKKIITEYIKKGVLKKDALEISKFSKNNSQLRINLQRRFFNEPIEYIKGYSLFFKRKFFVDHRVYIPTVETEDILKIFLKDLKKDSVVLDVGVGSGALAITIKKEKPFVFVYGCDISSNALEVCRKNISFHKVKIKTFNSYYADDVNIKNPSHIIADLPWGRRDLNVLKSNTSDKIDSAPKTALYHPEGIFNAYLELFESIERKGWIPKVYFETGVFSKKEVEKIVPKGKKFTHIKLKGNSVSIVEF
jgi:HemK-like putative methylase